jgi:hypothetical protein
VPDQGNVTVTAPPSPDLQIDPGGSVAVCLLMTYFPDAPPEVES